ncbi:adenylyl-sulfate kinase [Flavobacteriaceae bacterium]|nr:adenylyl-sulfate kinase [Flavobacteriaceae bacterium]
MSTNNIFKQIFKIDRLSRAKKLNQTPKLIWFTGLSGSGKSAISDSLENMLFEKGFSTYSLDGDNIRFGLCKGLDFTLEDRTENIRRIAEVANLMLDAGLIVLASFISPLKSQRDLVREIVGEENFVEVYVSTPVRECEKRDIKGLYKKARCGEIENFTGISSVYETPEKPDIIIDATDILIKESIQIIYNQIKNQLNAQLHN